MSDRDRLSLAGAFATALATSTLFSVFEDARFVLTVLGVVAVVAAASMLSRAARVPAALVPLVTLGAATIYVVAVFAGDVAVGRVFPGPGAVRALRHLAGVGFDDVQALAAPVPTHTGLVLLAVGGVGLVAVVVDALVAALRRPPLAGLPLLGLYAVPAAVVPGGVGLIAFVLCVAGYLLLLAADNRDRLARWGRPLRTSAQAEHTGRIAAASLGEEEPAGAMGRRIGAAAIGLAIVVPVVTPSFDTALFGGGGGSGDGTGSGGATSSSVTTYNPILRLKDQLNQPEARRLLTLTTDDPRPARYLRLAGLDRFNGKTWSQSPMKAGPDERVPGGLPDTIVAGAPVHTTITVSKALDARWLPLPYQPRTMEVTGDWRFDTGTDSVFTTKDNARGKTFTVDSVTLAPAPDTLRAVAPLEPQRQLSYTGVPVDLDPLISRTAADIRAKGGTAFDRALLIQRYFSDNGFRYSTSVPAGNSTDAIVNFLTQKQGYCEQYAATMALLARLNGIPARVAVGFTYGTQQPDGSYLITSHDAHAWPELYFNSVGWLPFEPTPTGAREGSVAPNYSTGQVILDQKGHQVPPPPPPSLGPLAERFGANASEGGPGGPGPGESLPSGGAISGRLVGIGALVLLLLLVAPIASRHLSRRMRRRRASTWVSQAHIAWAELVEDARDLGHRWPRSASPRGARDWLVRTTGVSGAALTALDDLVTAEERASYASPSYAPPAGHADLAAARQAVSAALAAHASPARRWAARLVPATSFDGVRRGSGALADGIYAIERTVSTGWHRRLRRRTAV